MLYLCNYKNLYISVASILGMCVSYLCIVLVGADLAAPWGSKAGAPLASLAEAPGVLAGSGSSRSELQLLVDTGRNSGCTTASAKSWNKNAADTDGGPTSAT
jgi:hypothetical protein